jgi:hypothetical protein
MGLRPIVFGPGTPWRTWGTRPVPIGFCYDTPVAGLCLRSLEVFPRVDLWAREKFADRSRNGDTRHIVHIREVITAAHR